MNASTQKPSSRRPRAALLSALLGVLAAGVVTGAAAQSSDTERGNLIIERDITPRDAFVPVPKSQDPISVQVQTFPTQTFDGAIGAMASDLDLNSAHGTTGITGNGFMPSLVGPNSIEHMLAGGGNTVPVGAGASLGGVGGIGSSIAQTVSGALAPLGAALGAMK